MATAGKRIGSSARVSRTLYIYLRKMATYTLKNLVINVMLLAMGIFFLICNFIIGVQKPVWLDEINTFLTIGVSSIAKLVSNIYSGCDTNPPLYFVIAFAVTKITSLTVIVLKLLSLFFALAGLIIFYTGYADRMKA